nr:hypothetical protein [Sinosporangium siamense]
MRNRSRGGWAARSGQLKIGFLPSERGQFTESEDSRIAVVSGTATEGVRFGRRRRFTELAAPVDHTNASQNPPDTVTLLEPVDIPTAEQAEGRDRPGAVEVFHVTEEVGLGNGSPGPNLDEDVPDEVLPDALSRRVLSKFRREFLDGPTGIAVVIVGSRVIAGLDHVNVAAINAMCILQDDSGDVPFIQQELQELGNRHFVKGGVAIEGPPFCHGRSFLRKGKC